MSPVRRSRAPAASLAGVLQRLREFVLETVQGALRPPPALRPIPVRVRPTGPKARR